MSRSRFELYLKISPPMGATVGLKAHHLKRGGLFLFKIVSVLFGYIKYYSYICTITLNNQHDTVCTRRTRY